ncbi:hypothetical protein Tco_1344982 [Tanacetum coccineum]
MAWFEQLETHLRDLYLNSSSHAVDAFKPAFHSFFGEEHQTFRVNMLHNLDQLRLQLERDNLLELQSQDVQINPVQAVDDSLIVSKNSWIESENNNALSKSVNETQLQQHENKHDTSSSSRTYITHAVDADIRPVNDQVPFAEMKDHNDSLIAQVNSKTVENADLKAKIQEKKPGRQIAIGQRFSPKKSSAVHEKSNTPRSCPRWKPTGRISKIVVLGTTNLRQIDDVCSHQFRPCSSMTNDVCSHQFRPCSSMTNDVCSHQFRPRSSMTNNVCSHQLRPRSFNVQMAVC